MVITKKDEVDVQLSSLSREEHTVIDEYFKSKGKKVLNEMNDDVIAATAVDLSDDEDEEMDDASADRSGLKDKRAARADDDDEDESGELST